MMISRKRNFMKCDIREKKDNFLLELDLPGLKKENIKAYVEDGYLIVTATKDADSKTEEKNFIRRERYHGEMERSFFIGKEIRQEELKATYQHGVLKIVIPKHNPKEIEERGKITIS